MVIASPLFFEHVLLTTNHLLQQTQKLDCQGLKIVESNGCLAVKPKIPKMPYAEAARVSDVVKAQDRLIANGGDPTTSLDRLATTGPNRPKANDEKPITGLVNLDIKKK